jgi:hypothetical protein
LIRFLVAQRVLTQDEVDESVRLLPRIQSAEEVDEPGARAAVELMPSPSAEVARNDEG